jgi:hypothetical protein
MHLHDLNVHLSSFSVKPSIPDGGWGTWSSGNEGHEVAEYSIKLYSVHHVNVLVQVACRLNHCISVINGISWVPLLLYFGHLVSVEDTKLQFI